MAREEPSDWGKLQLGQPFQVLALDVFRALAHAGLGQYEWIVMQYVIEQSWYTSLKQQGKDAPPNACNLSTGELARAISAKDATPKAIEDVQRQIRRARNLLVAKNLLLEVGEQLLPNKDADTWTQPGSKAGLLSDEEIAYARRIQVGRNATKKTPKPDKRVRGHRTNESGGPDLNVRKSGQMSPEDRTNESGALIEERPRKKISEEEIQIEAEARRPRACDPRTPIASGVEIDPKEIARAYQLAESAMLDDVVKYIDEAKGQFPSAWFPKAIKRLRLRGKRFGFGLVRTLLMDWHRAGGPDAGIEDEYDDDLMPLPASTGARIAVPFAAAPALSKTESQRRAWAAENDRIAAQEALANGHG